MNPPNESGAGASRCLIGLAATSKDWLRLDLVAGLTTAAVVVPKAMAYATVAGLPVEIGLYTAFVPMVIYAILGTSRPLSVSTTTTLAILTGTQLALVVPGGDPAALLTASATLAVLVGIMLILASVLRLGVVASFISEPVLTGFKAGIGLVIILDQVPKLLGIHFDKGGFLQNLLALIHHLPETSLATLAVGVAMLVILVGDRAVRPARPGAAGRRRAGHCRRGPARAPETTAWRRWATSPRVCRPSRRRASIWSSSSGPAHSASRS